jgi:hypothetical protein
MSPFAQSSWVAVAFGFKPAHAPRTRPRAPHTRIRDTAFRSRVSREQRELVDPPPCPPPRFRDGEEEFALSCSDNAAPHL